MLTCFLDESTACGESDPATCVAGYIATGKQWDIFRRAWNRMMKHYQVDLLHTVEIETEQARKHSIRYNKWSSETVKEFQSDIQGIIVGTGLQDIGMAIPLSVYNSVITSDRRKRFGNAPDRLCALLAMLSAGEYAWANKSVYKQAPSFVFEQGGRYTAEVRRAHNYFTTRSPIDFYSLSTLTFAPKSKEFPELQAADYLAFNISKRASHVVDPHPPPDAPIETMPNGKTVRRMRYPLQALYSEKGGEVRYSPTADVLEKIMTRLEENNYC